MRPEVGIPLAGGEPGTGPQKLGCALLVAAAEVSPCTQADVRGLSQSPSHASVSSSRLPGCPAQAQPPQENTPPRGVQPALVPGVREFGTVGVAQVRQSHTGGRAAVLRVRSRTDFFARLPWSR